MMSSANGHLPVGSSRENHEPPTLEEHPMPQMFDIAGRHPTRLRWLYRQLVRFCSPLHDAFHAGWTPEGDRARSFPCDDYITSPVVSCYRGIEVQAPCELVFRWLCQIRVAPYSYDWLDNFGRQSPRELTPGLGPLAVGQPFLVMFRVVDFVENEHITTIGETFEWIAGQRLAMTYRVVPSTAGSCRVVVKIVAHNGPETYLNRLRRDFVPLGEFLLMRKQLSTIKQLAEKQFLEELADDSHVASDATLAAVSG
jgi:hypothetical protein